MGWMLDVCSSSSWFVPCRSSRALRARTRKFFESFLARTPPLFQEILRINRNTVFFGCHMHTYASKGRRRLETFGLTFGTNLRLVFGEISLVTFLSLFERVFPPRGPWMTPPPRSQVSGGFQRSARAMPDSKVVIFSGKGECDNWFFKLRFCG